jgi:hypothetical protein
MAQVMPVPDRAGAPTFDGKTRKLLENLELFESLAATAGLTTTQKVAALQRYCRRKVWVEIKERPTYAAAAAAGADANDWRDFRNDILQAYPGAADVGKVSIGSKDLWTSVTKSRKCLIQNLAISTERSLDSSLF